MIDFKQTFRIRRAIWLALQQGQKSESQIAERSKEIAIHGKREMLLILSAWLLELDSTNALTAAEREEIQSLTQMSLEKWIQLQGVAKQIEEDLKEAESKQKEAEAARNKKAPFGTATKLFADAESKAQIKTLQNKVAELKGNRERLYAALKQNIEKRQVLGELFLRDCLNQRDKLAATQALGKQVAAISDRMISETNAIWVGHMNQQMNDLDQIANFVDYLRGCYKDMPVASPQQHNVSSPAVQEETQSIQKNSL